MVCADLGRAVAVFGLVFAQNLYVVLALIFIKGVFSTFFSPARQATIASVVPKDDLLAANSLSQLSFQVTKILGPVIGGFLWDLTGNYAAAIGMSFVFSLVGLSSVLLLPSTARRLIANWEESLPPEARASA